MSTRSAWRRGGKPEGASAQRSVGEAQGFDGLLGQALQSLRNRPPRILSWERTAELIHTGKKEREMPNVTHAGLFAWSRKWVLVAVASVAMLLAFFAVPFSQTQPLGANILFELDDAGDWDFGSEPPAEALEDSSLGIIERNIKVRRTGDGQMAIEFLVLTENGIVPSTLVDRLVEQYPRLGQARVTVTPILETSTGSMFSHLTGDLEVQVNCEGKTAEEIETEIFSQLAARGVEDADVQVEREGDDKVKIRVEVREEAP